MPELPTRPGWVFKRIPGDANGNPDNRIIAVHYREYDAGPPDVFIVGDEAELPFFLQVFEAGYNNGYQDGRG